MLARQWPGGIGLLLLVLSWGLHAMPPRAERLEWHGKTYALFGEPLEQRYPDRAARPRFMSVPLDPAGTDRGYIGSWRLEDDRLYLVDIDGWLCAEAAVSSADCRRANLAELFGTARGTPVFAEWYSGELVLPDGDPLPGMETGDSALHERTIRITLKAGKVTRIETIDNVQEPGRER